MASNDLRLRIVLDMAERVLAPLKRIHQGGTDAAKALRATRDKLKELNAQQAAVGEFRSVRTALSETKERLDAAQAKVKTLAQQMAAAGPPTRAMAKELTGAKKEAAQLGDSFGAQSAQAQRLRDRLHVAGLSTSTLSTHERKLRADIAATTQSIDAQKAALAKAAALKNRHGKEMASAAMMGAGGAAGIGAGRAVGGGVKTVMNAFATEENAGTGLKASMMLKDGSVAAEFAQVNALAVSLGDRLPGTTADFQNMMTTLKRQGVSVKTILGGTGESAAYLGVQLKMAPPAAAEFAAKMQDATQTTEADMMGLMDVIQKTYYLGVDAPNMLQGFTKIAAVMPLLRQRGLEASKTLAPLLVMMDQSGMAGEASGNAIRKIVQLGLDEKKVGKANGMLAGMKAGFKLEFADKSGKFAGLDNLFAQLQRIKAIESDVKRTSVLKSVFGDDAETHQVLNTLMDKGVDGYREVAAKMEAQADLRKRVEVQLRTLSNVTEAAQGVFTNLLASVGETYAEELKAKVEWLGKVASATGAWVRENKALVGGLLGAVAGTGALLTVLGVIGVALATIRVPLSLVRFGFGLLGLKAPMVIAGLKGVGSAVLWLGRALLLNPIGLFITLLATAAFMVYKNWEGIKGGLVAIWEDVSGAVLGCWERMKTGAVALGQTIASTVGDVWQRLGGSFPAVLATITAAILNWSPLGLFYQAFAAALGWFGIELPTKFTEFGRNMIVGLVNGITGMLGWVKDAIVGVAGSAVGWFKEVLGIQSPSRVFMAAGENVAQGAALGITSGQDQVRRAAVAMAAAATVGLPGLAGAVDTSAVAFDHRPPISAAGAPGMLQGSAPGGGATSIVINIQAAPGMDPQALARAVAAELDRRERQKNERRLSSLSDIG